MLWIGVRVRGDLNRTAIVRVQEVRQKRLVGDTTGELQTYFLGPNGARDTQNESDDYWTVYVAYIFEFGPANPEAPPRDNDLDPEFGLLGWTYSEGQTPGLSLVAVEVLRDVAAQNMAFWVNTPNSELRVLQIVSLHEVGHQFLGDGHHEGVYPSFVMVAPSTDADERRIPEMQLQFSPDHIAEIREAYKSGRHP